MDMPNSGGRWVRDPETGSLRRVVDEAVAADPTSAEAAPASETPLETAPPSSTSDVPTASAADRKKGK